MIWIWYKEKVKTTKSMAELEYKYGMKVRIYPSDHQEKIIKVNSDASRFIYNQMVALNKELYQLKKITLSIEIVKLRVEQLKSRRNTRQLSNHYQFLEDKRIDSLTKANAIQNYQKAWNLFHKVHKSGVPKFHRKSYTWKYQTNCQYPNKKHAYMSNGTVRFLDKKHIFIPKLGRIRLKTSRFDVLNLKSEIRIGTVTISKDPTGNFFLSLQLASDKPFVKKMVSVGSKLGIDLNIKNFLTDSNGNVVANPRYYRIIKKKLSKEQRKLSRRQVRAKKEHRVLRCCKNYQKQRLVVSKLLNKVRNQRKNFLQKLSTTLIKNHDQVVAEELRSKNLLKNHALAMSIADAGWRMFLGMLEYKANLYGREFVTVDPKNTTQTCNDCKFVMGTNNTEKLTLSDREWNCPNCGVHHIRDWNAANNILEKGQLKLD